MPKTTIGVEFSTKERFNASKPTGVAQDAFLNMLLDAYAGDGNPEAQMALNAAPAVDMEELAVAVADEIESRRD